MKAIKLNENERATLNVLDEATDTWGEMCVSFSYIAGDGNNLTIKDVRRACRSLRKKGLAEFYRGLMNEDGQVAGSGYCISTVGRAFMHPCDVCGEYATFDYDGKKECEAHYKQSPGVTPSLL